MFCLELATKWLQPNSLQLKVAKLQRRDKELDEQIAALQPYAKVMRDLTARLQKSQTVVKPVLAANFSVQPLADQIRFILLFRKQFSSTNLTEQSAKVQQLKQERQELELQLASYKTVVEEMERENDLLAQVADKAIANKDRLALLLTQTTPSAEK